LEDATDGFGVDNAPQEAVTVGLRLLLGGKQERGGLRRGDHGVRSASVKPRALHMARQ